MEKKRSQFEEASQNKIRSIQEKMQNEINLAEENKNKMQRKFSEERTKTNQVTKELIAEKQKSNLLDVELYKCNELTSLQKRLGFGICSEINKNLGHEKS